LWLPRHDNEEYDLSTDLVNHFIIEDVERTLLNVGMDKNKGEFNKQHFEYNKLQFRCQVFLF